MSRLCCATTHQRTAPGSSGAGARGGRLQHLVRELAHVGDYAAVALGPAEPIDAELRVGDLRPLVGMFESEGLASFASETPKEGTPAPGMEHCTMSLRSAGLKVEDKKWRSTDEFSLVAAEAERALGAELSRLGALAAR